ncbi:YifB family Mg chelatase-like AAA ATPase [Henriciella pelagia]|uniref:YifB family Mg chelatase-like AAA ATPase n=1 Tax=Henriciella pelagia TaxID=1977912 RepID=UPI00351583D6
MVCRITTFAFEGIEAKPVDVQVQITSGNPFFTIVGLPDKAVGESRERVRAAFSAIGLALPPKRITVNLAPADLPKEGSHYDLAIALGVLAAMGVIAPDSLDGHAAIGELSLDGALGQTLGVLPAAMAAIAMDLRLICPEACGPEAAWAGEGALAAPSLISMINHFAGRASLVPPIAGELAQPAAVPDLADVKGQEGAKRVLEIAAAGGHNLLFCGPPGSGKSMLAQRLPGLLPPLSASELLEVSQIQSVAGLLERGQLSRQRPFRAPHHSASMAALVGGGIKARPGEVSLAHHGVLFLDELPEFPAQVLDSLRQPLEDGSVVISRANRHVRYPARFQLIVAMNPCRCGGGPGDGACKRGPTCAQSYQSRISGPFFDRIDLFFDTPPVTAMDLALPAPSEGTSEAAARVRTARDIQTARYSHAGEGRRPVNADAPASQISEIASPDERASALLSDAASRLALSARAYHRVLKVARTIADLDGAGGVRRVHLAEALSYRRRIPGDQPISSPASLAR